MALTTMADLEKDLRKKRSEESLRLIKNVYLVMSGKGGVGKSTVAANLAAAKALMGFKVGLVDVDLHGPNIPGLLGLNAKKIEAEDGRLQPLEYILNSGERLKVVSAQNLLDNPDEAVIWRGPRKISAIKSFFSMVNWETLDSLIIDSPPGTGDELLTISSQAPDVKPIMVTTGHPSSLSDVRKALGCLRKLNLKPLGLIENQAYLNCPGCGETINLFSPEGALKLAADFDLPVLARLPWDLAASQSQELDQPELAVTDNNSPLGRAILKAAEKI